MQAGTLTGVRGLDRDVLIRLSYEDLLRACTTNRGLSAYCRDDNFWKDFLQNKFPSITTKNLTLRYGFPVYNYKTWRQYAEVIFTNAKLIVIPSGSVPADLKTISKTSKQFKALNEIARPYLINVKRGDIVEFADSNNYKCIYDGAKLEYLDKRPNQQDMLPRGYKLNEFIDPGRWFTEHQITGNTRVWVDFRDPIYQIVTVQPKYIIVKRDNIYHTITPTVDAFERTVWSKTTVRIDLYYTYSYDIDGTYVANPIYDDIRSNFKGYVLIIGPG
jgi:hypothetical protein